MTTTTIELRAAITYGKVRYYPGNECAKTVVDLTGRQTVTLHDINLLRKLGFVVTISADAAIAQALSA
jgi:hypothetical protein